MKLKAVPRIDDNGDWIVIFPEDVELDGDCSILTNDGHASGDGMYWFLNSRTPNASELKIIKQRMVQSNYDLDCIDFRNSYN